MIDVDMIAKKVAEESIDKDVCIFEMDRVTNRVLDMVRS